MRTQEELLHRIGNTQDVLLRDYFRIPRPLNSIIRSCVQGNTFRAYQKGKTYTRYKPSSIFRVWAQEYFLRPEVEEQLLISQDFEAIHRAAVGSLKEFWQGLEPEASDLRFFHFAKLIDLFFKCISGWDELTSDRRDFFFNRVHVPLDKYSLSALLEYVSPEELGIGNYPSMNSVKNEDHYRRIQKVIIELVSPFPPILFDLYAWNDRRREVEVPEVFVLEKA